jgi:hypothetical protein
MEQVNLHRPDAVFVDATGIGWGVCDRLSQLGRRHRLRRPADPSQCRRSGRQVRQQACRNVGAS